MTSEKAKAFIRCRLKNIALIMLPLTAVAVSAHASVVLSGSASFSAHQVGADVNIISPFESSQLVNGVNGISLFGADATFTAQAGGPGASGSSPCQNMCAGYQANGTASGTFNSSQFFVNYDFTLSDSNGQPMQWYLWVGLCADSTCYEYSNSATGTVTSGQIVTDNMEIPVSAGDSPTYWDSYLQLDFGPGGSFSQGDQIAMSILGGESIDIGVPAPEPGGGTMLAMGGAALAFLRKRFGRR